MHDALRRAAWLLALALASAGGLRAQAAGIPDRSQQKQAAEDERAGLQQKLGALKNDILRNEAARDHAADELAQSEKAISEANRTLFELTARQTETERRLARVAQDYAALTKTIAGQQEQLGRLLRNQYITGNEDRIKLFLSGENPNRINRNLYYLGRLSQAQAVLLDKLHDNLKTVETNRIAEQKARDELREIAQEQQQQKSLLEKEKSRRATLLASLSGKLAAQRREAGNLERDEQRMAGLIDHLSHLIEEQRKAEKAAREAAREKQRQAALAEARERERKRQQQLALARERSRADDNAIKDKSRKTSPNPDAIDDDEPPAKSAGRSELAPLANVQDDDMGHAFSGLRGKLRMPVRGELLARFGSKRNEGPSWKGLFIRAAEGAEIKAVAAGKVVFAEWLRGFGNLVIIDHGDQYMTIYGNNQAILKRVGDKINTGDTIASAGNSGGNEQSGLYFEMRHQGRAFDPLTWMATR